MSWKDMTMTIKPSVSKLKRQIIMSRTRNLVTRLTDFQILKGRSAQMTELELSNICFLLNEILVEEPSCLSLKVTPNFYVVGDVLGHFLKLLQTLNELGHPPSSTYLFLGNYVNRGDRSIETIALLFGYKLLYPNKVFLLRGNHESNQLGRTYGFYFECTRHFSSRLWGELMETFNFLPAAAILDDCIFCTHSGISPSVIYSGHTGPKELRDYLCAWIPRPIEIEASLLLTHLTWSEPDAEVEQWQRNPAGLGYLFGSRIVEQFCTQFGIQQMIRSNEMTYRGYEFFCPELVTIFSAPNFLGSYKNCGAVLCLNRNRKTNALHFQVKTLKPIVSNRGKSPCRNLEVVDASKCLT
ncbi:unnamed protein product [Calicophoron daubneyi]|uniref:Serine/threonine-protein phosphatase n=1 Tax=Calicophoron daubneyi TaxID=300641 RepID=A0AAV2TGN1_CALDB